MVTKSLGKVGKGAAILFIGTGLGLIFGFFIRVLIARFYSVEHYGVYNLYYSFLLIFGSIAAVGLRDGLNRYIGYYRGKEEEKNIYSSIRWGIIIGTISSLLMGAILYLSSGYIAPILAEDPFFEYYLKIAAITVPFYTLLLVLISVFRGFERTKERIFFSNLGRNSLILISILVIGFLSLEFEMVIVAVSISIISITVALYIYYRAKIEDLVSKTTTHFKNFKVGKELLLFSLPLLIVSIMAKVMGYTDTMMLAYFQTETEVGLYNAAKPISRLIGTGLIVSVFIYQPLVSKLYAQKKFEENDLIYNFLTKWISFLTLPMTLCFILFPEVVLSIFGVDYTIAASTLQVLAIAYFIRNLTGPNHSTLIGYGKSKFVMYANSGGAILNVAVNALLIPIYGTLGAAIATGVSLTGMKIIKSIKVYKLSGIHILKPYILKPVIFTSIIALLIGVPIRRFFEINLPILGVLFGLFLAIFFMTMVLTKSISKQDIKLLLLVEKRTGLDLKRTKRILNKFL